MLYTDFELQVKVTSGGQSVYDTHYVDYALGKQGVADTETLLLPEHFALHQNHPNPFNPTTEIKFDLPKPGDVTLSIFNIARRQVRSLIDGPKAAGYHSVLWDGKDDLGNEVASGVYLYRIRVLSNGAGNQLESAKKMTLVR
jgi:hypothetical protein